MMSVLSSGKDIHLHDFPTLESSYSLKRSSIDPRTLFTFPYENIFASIYQDNRIDLVQAYKGSNGSNKIKRIKKFKLDGVTCGSVMFKDGKHEIAMGLTNGTIEFVDFNLQKLVDKKFSSDAFGNSVVDIGFNNIYDVLASTYERGELQLFDMKSNRKLQRFKLDMKSHLVRFHPTNPHLLAVSSLAGGLTILNINLKRSTYNISNAHKNYSKDMCWSTSTPSVLISVGNDCLMKVFDVRQNTIVSQTKHMYPYSSLAISPCGNFCCAGNMKGFIMSYDLRNINTVLHTNNSHEGSSVTKLFFPPCSLENESNVDANELDLDSEIDQDEIKEKPSNRRNTMEFMDLIHPKPNPGRQSNSRRSIDDFYDICTSRIVNKEPNNELQLDTLNTVLEESVNNISSFTLHNGSVRENNELNESQPKNKRLTLLPSELQIMFNSTRNQEPVVRRSILKNSNVNESNKVLTQTTSTSPSYNLDNKENYREISLEVSSSQNQVLAEKNNNLTELDFGHSNAAFISQMNEMCEKIQNLETRLDATMYNVNEKVLNMEKKLDAKMDDISAQIQHGFLSIHCNLWAVAESDITQIKSMVSTMHDSYRKIEDVFLENARLKDQINELKRGKDEEDS